MKRKRKAQKSTTFTMQKKVDHNNRVNGQYIDLPPEMLTMILKYLSINNLLKCRFVNSQWNEICCTILQIKTRNFAFHEFWTIVPPPPLPRRSRRIPEKYENSMTELMKVFGPSKDETSAIQRRPYLLTAFHIKDLDQFNLKELEQFVLLFGPKMKSLTVDTENDSALKIEHLLKLLMKFAPTLQHLYIMGNACLKNVNLVVPANHGPSGKDPNDIPPHDIFPQLKVLEMCPIGFRHYNNFLQQIIARAPLMQEIFLEYLEDFSYDWTLDNFKILYDLEILHMVRQMDLRFVPLASLSSHPTDFMNGLKVDSFFLDCDINSVFNVSKEAVGNYINIGLQSSRDRLKVINMYAPQVMYINACFQDIACFPNVREIEIYIQGEVITTLNRLGQLCPNTKILNIGYIKTSFAEEVNIIWTKFKKLETLKLTIGTFYAKVNALEVDAAFSGYSERSINEINEKVNEGALLENARNGEKQGSSILDLKDLRCLELKFSISKKTIETKSSKAEVEDCIFMKMLPQYIRENPTSISVVYVQLG